MGNAPHNRWIYCAAYMGMQLSELGSKLQNGCRAHTDLLTVGNRSASRRSCPPWLLFSILVIDKDRLARRDGPLAHDTRVDATLSGKELLGDASKVAVIK